MQDAFGVDLISKALADSPRGLVTLMRYTGSQSTARVGGGAGRTGAEVNRRMAAGQAVRDQLTKTPLAIEAPKYHLPNGLAVIPKPKPEPVSVPKTSNTSRKLKWAAGTGAAAVASGGAVLGADALRKKKSGKRVQLAG